MLTGLKVYLECSSTFKIALQVPWAQRRPWHPHGPVLTAPMMRCESHRGMTPRDTCFDEFSLVP